jgi:hypothetical protein
MTCIGVRLVIGRWWDPDESIHFDHNHWDVGASDGHMPLGGSLVGRVGGIDDQDDAMRGGTTRRDEGATVVVGHAHEDRAVGRRALLHAGGVEEVTDAEALGQQRIEGTIAEVDAREVDESDHMGGLFHAGSRRC